MPPLPASLVILKALTGILNERNIDRDAIDHACHQCQGQASPVSKPMMSYKVFDSFFCRSLVGTHAERLLFAHKSSALRRSRNRNIPYLAVGGTFEPAVRLQYVVCQILILKRTYPARRRMTHATLIQPISLWNTTSENAQKCILQVFRDETRCPYELWSFGSV